MWWALSFMALVWILWWTLWRERYGNREAPKSVGSAASQHPGRPARRRAAAPTAPGAPAVGASPRLGVIPAWRSWRVDADLDPSAWLVVRLVSESRDDYWDGPTMQADQEPTLENSSGIYAAKDWDNRIIPGHYKAQHLRVIGRVGLYGKVIEAERGYRAERCVIEELWIIDAAAYLRLMPEKQVVLSLPMIASALATRYQVDVHEGGPNLPATHYLAGPDDDEDDDWDN